MKLLKSITLLLAGTLLFTACEDTKGPVLNPDAEAPVITAPSSGESFILEQDHAEESLFTLEWTAPDFGYPAAVSYRVEMDPDAANFDNRVNMGSVNTTSFAMMVGELNNRLLSAGLPAEAESTVSFRVRASLGGGTDPLYSDPIQVDVTPYDDDVAPEYPEQLFMIGASVGDWDWGNTNLEMVPVATKPYLFWKIVWIEAGVDDAGYKFAPERGWGNDFGWDEEPPVDEIYGIGGDNMPEPAESGYYMVVVNLETEEIAVTAPLVYLIGDTVESWDTANEEALFTVDNDNEVITITRELEAAELRMYAWFDKGWFTDWWQSEFMIFDGEIEFRGAGDDQDRVNINPAGEYTIDLNFRTYQGAIEMQ